ncbi:hypothetical protein D3C85_1645530 [compost metagenome]
MNDIRARFEEIWPVPEGVYWYGEYLPDGNAAAIEHNARLSVFIACKETTNVYVSLVDDLVKELEEAQPWILQDNQYMECGDLLIRAKQIMEQKK